MAPVDNSNSDFIIKVGSNISQVMSEIEKAIQKAKSLESSLNTSQQKAGSVNSKLGSTGAGTASHSNFSDPKAISLLAEVSRNTAMTVALLNRVLTGVGTVGTARAMGAQNVEPIVATGGGTRRVQTPVVITAEKELARQMKLRGEGYAAAIAEDRRLQVASRRVMQDNIEAASRARAQSIVDLGMSRVVDKRAAENMASRRMREETEIAKTIKQNAKLNEASIAKRLREGTDLGQTAAQNQRFQERGVARRLIEGTELGRTAAQNQRFDIQRTGRSIREQADIGRTFRQNQQFQGQLEGKGAHGDVVESAFRRALVWGAVSTAIFKAVDAAGTFIGTMITMDKQIADLRKTVQGTDADFQKLVDSAINIARSYKVGTQEVLDAIEIFSKQFKDTGDLETLAKSAALFSNISGQTVKQSAETLTSTIQQYNLSVASAVNVTDSWANVAANSAVGINDLGDAVGVVGQIAETAGVKFNMLNAMVATVASSTGKSGREIGNAFKRIFERTFSPENAKVIENIGGPGKGIALLSGEKGKEGQFRNFNDILQDTADRWGSLTTTQQKNLAVAFAGARQYDSFIALMTNWNQVIGLTDVSLNSLGAAQRQNEKIGDTFVKKLQQISTEFDAMARKVGSVFLPLLGGLTSGFIGLLKIINTVPGAIHAVTLALAALTASGAGKFLFNQFGSTLKEGVKFTNQTRLGRTLSPFITNPNTQDAAFSLGQGVRSLGGAVAGAAPRVGAAASFGTGSAMLTGITTLVAGFAALATATIGLAFIFDQTKNKTKEFSQETFGKLFTSNQESAKVRRSASRISSVIGGAGSGGLSEEAQIELGTVITDLKKDDKLRGLIEKSGVDVDFDGRIVNASIESLSKLAKAMEELSVTDAATARLKVFAATVDSTFIPSIESVYRKFLMFLGLATETRTGTSNVAQEANTNFKKSIANFTAGGSRLGLGSEAFSSRGGDILKILSNKNISRDQQVESLAPIFGIQGNIGPEQKMLLSNLAGGLGETAVAGADFRANMRSTLVQQREAFLKKGASKTDANKAIKQLISSQRSAFDDKALGELFIPDINEVIKASDKGAFGAGDGKTSMKSFNLSPVDRIDFALNKSLISNTRNFESFGGEVKFLENAVAAYKQAISDLNNATGKAAGPLEERGLMLQQITDKASIALIQEREQLTTSKKGSDIYKTEEERRERIVDINKEILAIQEKNNQGIKKQTVESEFLKQKYLEQLRFLEQIKDLQDYIRAPISNALSNSVTDFGERGLANGQSNILGQRGLGELEVQKIVAQRKLERAEQQQAKTGTAGTATGRNELKRLREEIKAIDKQMDSVNKKTDTWRNLLMDVGKTAFESKVKKLTDSFTEGLGSFLTGDASKKNKPLGAESNPIVDALNSNRLALEANTAAMTGGEAKPVDLTKNTIRGLGAGQTSAAESAAEEIGKDNEASNKKWTGTLASALGGAVAGGATGSYITKAMGREGYGGAIGGAVGGILGNTVLAEYGGATWGPLVGGLIGAMFDKPITAEVPELEEVEDELSDINVSLQSIDKGINTVNETLENLINAPGNFSLPIPRGILENSITAQSALATPLQAGGLLKRSGLYFGHAGETVSPAGQNMSQGETSVSNVIHINGANKDPKEIADEVMSRLNRGFYDQNKRSGMYATRF